MYALRVLCRMCHTKPSYLAAFFLRLHIGMMPNFVLFMFGAKTACLLFKHKKITRSVQLAQHGTAPSIPHRFFVITIISGYIPWQQILALNTPGVLLTRWIQSEYLIYHSFLKNIYFNIQNKKRWSWVLGKSIKYIKFSGVDK